VPESQEEQRARYPLAAYNFRVTIDGVAVRFAKVSGLTREHQAVTYRHGLSFVEGEEITKVHMDRYSTVTMEQGTVRGSTFLHEWVERKDPCLVEVSLCDEKGVPLVAWTIAKALPVKISAPAFDARTNELAVDVLELRATGITIRHLD
jgi:phage tail-like protein